MNTPEFRLQNPPVQQVTLSLFSAPRFDLLNSHILPILFNWRESYPVLEEFPPNSTWKEFTRDELAEITTGESQVITPNFVISTSSGDRSIRIQQDRFEIVWRFLPDGLGPEYDGYRSLRQELLDRFELFSAEVEKVAHISLEVRRTDVTYENLIDLDVRTFCAGFLSDWENTSTRADLPTQYTGMRLGDFQDRADENTEIIVAIDPGPDGIGTNVLIDVQSTIVEGTTFQSRIDTSHDVALDLFLALTSPKMREGWGEGD